MGRICLLIYSESVHHLIITSANSWLDIELFIFTQNLIVQDVTVNEGRAKSLLNTWTSADIYHLCMAANLPISLHVQMNQGSPLFPATAIACCFQHPSLLAQAARIWKFNALQASERFSYEQETPNYPP